MHDTAYELGSLFFATYLTGDVRTVLDVGAQDVNGTLRHCCKTGCAFIGIDLSPGPSVDVVLDDPYSYPFEDNYFDAALSSSCFEHDQFFWLSFKEMVRVTKSSGFIYINSPSNGDYHPYPTDNWRFYPDAGLALEAWSKREGNEIVLVESFIARRKNDQWNDCVMIFFKGKPESLKTNKYVSDQYECYNIRRSTKNGVDNFIQPTEDMVMLTALQAKTNEQTPEGASSNDRGIPETRVGSETESTPPKGDLLAQLEEAKRRLALLSERIGARRPQS